MYLSGSACPQDTQGVTYSDSSNLFELQLVISAVSPTEHRIEAYVSDYATNTPIHNAELSFEATRRHHTAPAVLGQFKTVEAGYYRAHLAMAGDTTTDLVLTLRSKEDSDVFSFAIPPQRTVEQRLPSSSASIGIIAAIALCVLLVGGLWWKRSRASAITTTVALLCTLFSFDTSQAHEGHDHGGSFQKPVDNATAESTFTISKRAQFSLGIRTAIVTEQPLQSELRLFGLVTAIPGNQVTIYAPQNGKPHPYPGMSIPRLGSSVKKGQILAVLDPALSSPERLRLLADTSAIEARERELQEELDHARRDLARLEAITDVVPQKDIQDARLTLKLKQEGLLQVKRQKELYAASQGEAMRKNATALLTAPISGVVAMQAISPGELVTTTTPLMRIVDMSRVYVEAKVFEQDVSILTKAQSVMITSPTYPERRIAGNIVFLGQIVDPATRTIDLTVSVQNSLDPEFQLRLGMATDVFVTHGEASTRLTIPKEAIIEEGSGMRRVLVKTGTESFSLREIQVDRSALAAATALKSGIIPIQAGIAAGDRIVVKGISILRAHALKRQQ